MKIIGRLRKGELVPVARIAVTGYSDEPAYACQVEPWGEIFDVNPGNTLVITFLGHAKQVAAPGVEIAWAA